MSVTTVYSQVRAIYKKGVLNPLEPLNLPEGAQVQLTVQLTGAKEGVYPTHFVPAKELDQLTGLAPLGGDALVDSEALYDSDSP